MSALTEMARRLNDLLEQKAAIEQQEKDIKAEIQKAKDQMADQFVDDDVDSISVDGYTFAPKAKTAYSKRSDAALEEAGLVYFDVLREAGLGDIIVPTVNAKTLQSAVTAYVEEHGELEGNMALAINAYDYIDVERRKATAKKSGIKKGAKK